MDVASATKVDSASESINEIGARNNQSVSESRLLDTPSWSDARTDGVLKELFLATVSDGSNDVDALVSRHTDGDRWTLPGSFCRSESWRTLIS